MGDGHFLFDLHLVSIARAVAALEVPLSVPHGVPAIPEQGSLLDLVLNPRDQNPVSFFDIGSELFVVVLVFLVESQNHRHEFDIGCLARLLKGSVLGVVPNELLTPFRRAEGQKSSPREASFLRSLSPVDRLLYQSLKVRILLHVPVEGGTGYARPLTRLNNASPGSDLIDQSLIPGTIVLHRIPLPPPLPYVSVSR